METPLLPIEKTEAILKALSLREMCFFPTTNSQGVATSPNDLNAGSWKEVPSFSGNDRKKLKEQLLKLLTENEQTQ